MLRRGLRTSARQTRSEVRTTGRIVGAHPYLRAYAAGILIPSVFIFAIGISVAVFFFQVPPEIERAMIFPMSLNPFLWGIWNVLYVALRSRRRLEIGLHGALLSILLIACGILFAPHFEFRFVDIGRAVAVFFPTAVVYYVLWRFGVNFMNRVFGVSES